MAISKDVDLNLKIDPNLALKKQIEERKQKALELMIAEKADLITKVLGREYRIDRSYSQLFTPLSTYIVYEKGNRFQDHAFKIEMGERAKYVDEREEDSKFVRIAIVKKKKGFLGLLRSYFDDVYFQRVYQNSDLELDVFKDEETWLKSFNELHGLARCNKTLREDEEQHKKIKSLDLAK